MRRRGGREEGRREFPGAFFNVILHARRQQFIHFILSHPGTRLQFRDAFECNGNPLGVCLEDASPGVATVLGYDYFLSW